MNQHYIFGNFKKSSASLTVEDLNAIFVKADRASGKLQELPVEKIIDILSQVGANWLDQGNSYRREAMDLMPPLVGYSREMTAEAIDSLFGFLTRENLFRLLRGQLGRSAFLDRFEYIPSYDGYIRAQPLGTVLHVSPGNVFVGGVDSLIYGFLSKNINILKMSRQDPVFPQLFARSLQEVDEAGHLANSFCVLSFPSRNRKVEDFFKHRCDGIVVFGGQEAVESYRAGLPLGTRLVEYGPRYSFSIITSEGFAQSDPDDIFERCARDVVMWEQRACSSPQVIYLEKDIVDSFLVKFPSYLEKISHRYPQENLSVHEKIEVLKAREMARFEEAEGRAVLHKAHNSTRWTIIYEDSPRFKTSCLNRTIYIKPFSSWADILGQALLIKDHLQSVGILASTAQLKMLSKALTRVGVSRITRIGTMGTQKLGAPHDFDYPLRQLIKWVNIEWIDRRFDLGDRIAPAKPALSRWDRLKNLLRYARNNSEFYRTHLADVNPASIKSYEDFQQVPLLDKNHIYHHTPPAGEGMLTGPLKNAYVFASGGSTGEPKFTFYSYREIDEVASILADIYQTAGITRDDVVANLFMAGSMWTSFIVVNHAIEKIGCVSLPIAGNSDLELILRYMELFRPTAVVGLPSMIIRLAEEIEKRSLNLTMEKILYGGEHFSDEATKFLRQAVGARLIQSAGYASVEGGPIGYQTINDRGGVHRLLYEYMFLEILNPETLDPVDHGQPGEIVVTNFHRRLMPVIRYRTGDLGRMLPRSTETLHQTPLFELLGRRDDVLRIGAMSIYPDKIAEALGKVPGVSHLFQLEARYAGRSEELVLRVEATRPGDDYAGLSRRIHKALLDHDPELLLVVREKWLGSLKVEVLDQGKLPRNSRTGKIRKVIDNRTRTGAVETKTPATDEKEKL